MRRNLSHPKILNGVFVPRISSTSLAITALAAGGFAVGTTEFASMSLLPWIAEDLGVKKWWPEPRGVKEARDLGLF